jgi:hypothetical protein
MTEQHTHSSAVTMDDLWATIRQRDANINAAYAILNKLDQTLAIKDAKAALCRPVPFTPPQALSMRLAGGLLLGAHSALDDALGDSDVTHVEDDDELRDRHPVQWAAQRVAQAIELLEEASSQVTRPE